MAWLARWLQRFGRPPESKPGRYQVFTRDFDRTVRPPEFDALLGAMEPAHREQYEAACSAFEGKLQLWKVERQMEALEAASRVRRAVAQDTLDDTILTLLIDHSGSMKGQNVMMAAATADVALDLLNHLGVAVEVLGFTTSTWRGGKSRERWLKHGMRPQRPGRLCDRLHIVYRAHDDVLKAVRLQPMLRPDLLKENLDGEAIEWAAERLRAAPQRRRILLVISDGAPVDDSTLQANDLGFLARHLTHVIQGLRAAGDIRLATAVIGIEPNNFYEDATRVNDIEGLGVAVLGLVEALLTEDRAELSGHLPASA